MLFFMVCLTYVTLVLAFVFIVRVVAIVTSSPLDALLDHRVHLVPASSRKKAETTGQVTVFSRAKARQTSVNLNSHPSTSQTANVSSTSLTSNAPPQQPPPRDYTSLPILTSLPSVGDTIAYKVLFVSAMRLLIVGASDADRHDTNVYY